MRWEATVYVDGPDLDQFPITLEQLVNALYEQADSHFAGRAKYGINVTWPEEFDEVVREVER